MLRTRIISGVQYGLDRFNPGYVFIMKSYMKYKNLHNKYTHKTIISAPKAKR